MTNEEAKKFIAQSVKSDVDMALVADAIKALEQESCKDCISRQAVLDMAITIKTDDYSGNEIMDVVDIDDVKALPPVTPQPKTGYWIDGEKTRWKCSGCGYGVLDWNTTPYCPNCGAKMEVTTDETDN